MYLKHHQQRRTPSRGQEPHIQSFIYHHTFSMLCSGAELDLDWCIFKHFLLLFVEWYGKLLTYLYI